MTSKNWFAKNVVKVRDLFSNAKVRYGLGVILLLAFGTTGVVGGYLLFEQGASWSVTVGISEALLVSGILAWLVDPYLKRRIQDESGWDAVFGYLNPHAPPGLREAIQDLAQCQQYHPKTVWSAQFEWVGDEKKIVAVTLEARNTGVVVGREPFKPGSRLWVLASTSGHQTEYLSYYLSCPGQFDTIDFTGEALQRYVSRLGDRSIYIDEANIVDDREIPANVSFESLRSARMYRQPIGYIPLHHGAFVDHLHIELKGSALADLDVTVFHARRKGYRFPNEWKRTAGPVNGPESRDFERVIPGQMTLLSWSPSAVNITVNPLTGLRPSPTTTASSGWGEAPLDLEHG